MNKHTLRFLFCFFSLAAAPLAAQTAGETPAPPDTLPNLTRLSGEELNSLALRYQERTVTLKTSFSQLEQQAVLSRQEADLALKTARLDSTSSQELLKSLSGQQRTRKADEKTAMKNRRLALQGADLADRVVAMDSLGKVKNLPRLHRQLRELERLAPAPPPQPVQEAPPVVVAGPADSIPPTDSTAMTSAPPPTPPVQPSRPAKGFKNYDPEQDVMVYPPALPCQVAVEIRDEFSGEVRREMAPQELFRHINPTLKNQTNGQPTLIAMAALGQQGANPMLNLQLIVRDNASRKTFGGLGRNSMTLLKFLDGSTVTLYNLRADDGQPEPGGPGTVYRAQFGLDRATLKKIRTTGLDKIRLGWNAGYEDYEVHHVDLLQQQAKCLH